MRKIPRGSYWFDCTCLPVIGFNALDQKILPSVRYSSRLHCFLSVPYLLPWDLPGELNSVSKFSVL